MLIAIMVGLTVTVVCSLTLLLYQTSVEQQKERLLASVKSQARTLEAFTKNINLSHQDDEHGKEHISEIMLMSVRMAHGQYEGFGKTGEFVLAKLAGSHIHFLLSHRHGGLEEPPPVSINSEMAEPMRLALTGNSGTAIALDYRGEKVVAAFEYIKSLNIGVVAKIDLSEVREPFLQTALIGLLIAFVCIAGSVRLFHFVIMPFNVQLENQASKIEQINKRMRIATDSIELGIWDWDIKRGNVVWDKWMCKLYGLEEENFTGSIQIWQNSLHQDDIERVQQELDNAINTRTNFHSEFRITPPDSDIRHIKADAILILDDQNQPEKMIGINVDITEKVQLHEKLKRSGRLEAIGKLAGGIAHDFNNLLAIMMGRTELLKIQISNEDKAQESADHIIAAIERGKSLAKRLLVFSRRENAQSEVLNVALLLNNCEDLLKRTLGETISLSIKAGQDSGNIKVDVHQFENALINLSINAADAMPDGGSLTISGSNQAFSNPVDLYSQTVPAGSYVKIVVKDTGCGIAADALDQIFEPFFSTKSEEHGTGLGLSMVYGFVKQYGGFIDVKTRLQEGTEFILYFPVATEISAENNRPSLLPPLPKPQSGNILLVEDNQELLETTRQSLQIQGFRVVTAKDGCEALNIIHSNTPIDLLFSDIVLPGAQKGSDVANELHRLHPNTPVILTTGYAYDISINKDFYVLNKPYSRTDLLQLIQQCMQNKQVHRTSGSHPQS